MCLLQVRIEAIHNPVGQHGQTSFCGGEVAVKLVCVVIVVELLLAWLAFNQDGRLAAVSDGIIDFLSPSDPDVRRIFRLNFTRVEHIVSEQLDKRHDKGCLRRFFSVNVFTFTFDLCCKCSELIDEIHNCLPLTRRRVIPSCC